MKKKESCYACIFCSGQSMQSDGVMCELNNSDTFTTDACMFFIDKSIAVKTLVNIFFAKGRNG